MPFDKNRDSIAVVVPRFKLLKSSDGPLGTRHLYRNEPYLVTLAADARGGEGVKIKFNTAFYPNVRQGDTVNMLGDGHLVYAPANPGEWIAVSVLVMESDEDVRKRAEQLESLIPSVLNSGVVRRVLSVNPVVELVATAIGEVSKIITSALKKDRDDFLFRTQGTFLRDVPVPYHVNRSVRRKNTFCEVDLAVLPLIATNGQGPSPR